MGLTVGSLFSGIGGLDRGFEQAGFAIAWMCEKDPYARAVLAKHWPSIPIYEDITTLCAVPAVEVLVGGFPCQDISSAGRRKGLDGNRSGLWAEYIRIVHLVRPRYIVMENVAALVNRGLSRILAALAESGYDAEWQSISAASVGAPHIRERLFLVAYPHSDRLETVFPQRAVRAPATSLYTAAYSGSAAGGRQNADGLLWSPERGFLRVADGISARVDRIRCLGNAVVPQVAEVIGNLIALHHSATG